MRNRNPDRWTRTREFASSFRVPTVRENSNIQKAFICARPMVVLLLVLGYFLLVSVKETSAEADTNIRVVGEIPIFEPGERTSDGWLVVDSSSGLGFQVFNYPSFPQRAVFWAFDLDGLDPLVRAEIPGIQLLPTGVANYGDFVHAVDEEEGRIFVAGRMRSSAGTNQIVIVVIDEQTMINGGSHFYQIISIPPSQAALIGLSDPVGGGTWRGGGWQPFGMTFEKVKGRSKLLLLFSQPVFPQVDSNRPHVHYLVQWDVEEALKAAITDDWGDWIERLSACEQNQLSSASRDAFQRSILWTFTSIIVPCQGPGSVAQIGVIPIDEEGFPELSNGVPPGSLQEVYRLPRLFSNSLVDKSAQRILLLTEGNGNTWWAFDSKTMTWAGGMGVSLSETPITAGINPQTGRLYTLVDNQVSTTGGIPVQGGLLASDTRLRPVPQARNLAPDLAYHGQFKIHVIPAGSGEPSRIFLRRGSRILTQAVTYPDSETVPRPVEDHYLVLEDSGANLDQPIPPNVDEATIGRPPEKGITGSKFEAAASSYGLRVLFVGGLNALVSSEGDLGTCYRNDRELVFGAVTRSQLTNVSAAVQSVATLVDESSKIDFRNPASRCWPGQRQPPRLTYPDPLGEQNDFDSAKLIDDLVGQDWDENNDGKDDYTAECVSTSSGSTDAPKLGRQNAANATCDLDGHEVKGEAHSSVGNNHSPIRIGSASSETWIRVTGGQALSVTTAEAKNIEIVGIGSVGLIRTNALAAAGGYPGTAETLFERVICGVAITGFQAPACLTEEQQESFVRALNAALGRNGEARLREPDPDLRRGSELGYLAAIQRNRLHKIQDTQISRDDSDGVPGLEIIIWKNDSIIRGSGRQIFQFASVQASSAYGIFCLFGETEDDDCIRPTSRLRISLFDDFEKPSYLTGGVFEILKDADGDGTVGLGDSVVDLGTKKAVCTTGKDGTGDCEFDLPPGVYIVRQVTAPSGYLSAPSCVVSLPPWTTLMCEFVNSPTIGLVYINLTNDSPEANPLSGGEFELWADNGDEQLAKGDTKIATCTTDTFGDCIFDTESVTGSAQPIGCTGLPLESSLGKQLIEVECGFSPEQGGNVLAVELGTLIVHQATAPPDYDPAPDQVVELSAPWDRAIALFANGLKAIDGSLPIEVGTATRQTSVVIEDGNSLRPPVKQSAPRQQPPSPRIITRIVTAPSEGLSFLLRHPKQAAMFGSMWILLVGPPWLVWRRRSISSLKGIV